MVQNRNIGLVILAGGYGSRMATNKGLLPLGGKPAIEHILSNAQKAGIQHCTVVIGHYKEDFFKYGRWPGVEIVENPFYAKGMFSSVQRGVQWALGKVNGIFLLPVDCPLVSETVFRRLLASITNQLAVPTFLGKKGHPLYIPEKYFDEILSQEEQSPGLKNITRKYWEEITYLPVEEESVLLDMDTVDDYERLCAYHKEKPPFPSLKRLGQGRRFFLVRHGQIQQHQGKIFLGQKDVALSQRGMAQAQTMAKEIEAFEPKTSFVYTGTLVRALKTAEFIKGHRRVISFQELNEMALGDWDGKYIDEVKKEQQTAYRERGRNLWRYRISGISENFYDLQYRVYKKMAEILQEDSQEDVIIVSHKSCLRAIENNLKGGSIEFDWKELKPGQWRLLDLS